MEERNLDQDFAVSRRGDLGIDKVEVGALDLAHGAGRKWGRSQAKAKLVQRYSPETLVRTALGSRVVCEDRDLLYQEAPQAYKNVEVVIDSGVEGSSTHFIPSS